MFVRYLMKNQMRSDNIIQVKSFQFALEIIRTVKLIQVEKKEYILTKQILRSGTSIGANVEEAIGGASKRDFYAKMHIAYKEARETGYWIRLLRESNIYCNEELQNKLEELLRILGSILKSSHLYH